MSKFSTSATPPSSRENCFDLLRLILAGLVVYTHAYYVGGFGEEGFSRLVRGQTIAGTVGVLGFFGLSGFLVSESYVRSPDWLQFLRRRILRIMPGYWGCLVVTAVVLAPLMFWVQRGTLFGYAWAGNDSALTYVARNLALRIHQWSIGDVLAHAACSDSLNGSLWSLFLEFCCYLVLLLTGACGLLTVNRLWMLVCTGLLAVFHVLATVGLPLAPHTMPTLVTLTPLTPYVLAFFVGTCCRAFAEHVPLGAGGAVVFGVVGLVLLRFGGYRLAAPVIVPLFLLNLGYAFTLRLRHDLSYGAYVYAFPCQQLLAFVPGLRSSVAVFLLASLALTTGLAAASWFGVERRFLRRPSH